MTEKNKPNVALNTRKILKGRRQYLTCSPK